MSTTTPRRTAPQQATLDLTGLLVHASHVLATQLAAALGEIGMTQRGHCVLFHAMRGELTQIQLAEIGQMDKTTMVVTMDELERAGYAERRPSPTDRRARIVAVTPAGAEMALRGQEIVDRVHAAALDALPEDVREVFVTALQGLVEGHLSTPVESDRPVRRARQIKK
ncbi:winged helix-turn-helix transcriptional regulator [Solihabitans fulvus]|uniref:Winged helix-turn-helix transcriptional regulator n=1 Tax=Solihabitans fulvus TaxID=1892852 RepID=A0A5B2WQQ4_9PSEU|nr:MarR family winged helix-turn-helix transcriptional regulator [Solihabitans fulvus]KAA2253835.1 winged helix-turn-helix transcriptional regulator [Solihabitans fulvus]